MPAADPPEHLNTVRRLREELDRLTGEQIEAMEISTFRVLTTDEDKEYENRRARILELVAQLRLLEEAA
jgi:bisphosphoglycerate-dependent phosphoglycerate mutase